MKNLEQRLIDLENAIKKPSFRNGTDSCSNVGYYIFDYPEERELEIRESVNYLRNKYVGNSEEFNLIVYDLYDLVIDILQQKGYMEKCFELEEKRGFLQVSNAIAKALRITSEENLIVKHILENTPENSIVFLTGIGKIFPIIRAHSILNNLHQYMDNIPVILFYPGKYENQELTLFNIIKDANFYRANQF